MKGQAQSEIEIDFLRSPSSYSVRIEPNSETLLDRVVEKLRGAILNFHFRPGQRLIERKLCEELGVSRSSVREALRRLEAEGLIRTVPHKGSTVAAMSVQEAQSVYEVRAALEGFAAQLFAERATPDQVRRLRVRLRDTQEAVRIGDPHVMLTVKATFYEVILEGCGNECCAELVRSLQARIRFLRALSLSTPGRPERSIAEMARIVKAVEARNGDAARIAFAIHTQKAASVAIAELLKRSAGIEKADGAASVNQRQA